MRAGAARLGDGEIRAALLRRLRDRYHGDNDVALLQEVGLCRGQVFVDVAVVNGKLHGYEIKSDRDSLCRLSGQIVRYGQVLDRATLVVGRRHVEEGINTVPAWWEVQVATQSPGGVRLRCVRAGRPNPARDCRALAELLWLDDALALLHARDAARGYLGKPRRHVWDRVCEIYDIDEIAHAVREKLKARAAERSLPQLV